MNFFMNSLIFTSLSYLSKHVDYTDSFDSLYGHPSLSIIVLGKSSKVGCWVRTELINVSFWWVQKMKLEFF